MSQREFASWLKYRRKVGSLDMAYRMDKQTALICSVLTHGKVEPEKFMPRYEEDAPASFDGVFAMLKSKTKKAVKDGK
jgi:hypothetical protein